MLAGNVGQILGGIEAFPEARPDDGLLELGVVTAKNPAPSHSASRWRPQLGITVFAFELTRSAAGQPVTNPVTEGLEPEARADLGRPGQNADRVIPKPASTAASPPESWWPGC